MCYLAVRLVHAGEVRRALVEEKVRPAGAALRDVHAWPRGRSGGRAVDSTCDSPFLLAEIVCQQLISFVVSGSP
jgi:hypothetical protein